MNNISVTPKGGSIASELSGNQVNLTAPSLVKLNLNQSDIKSFTRNGNDLVVTTKSGETLVIHGFYGPNGESSLVLQDEQGALWWVQDPGTEGFHYVSIDSTDALLAEDGLSDNAIIGLAAAGVGLAGLAALIGSSNGGHDSNNDNNNGDGDNGGGNNGGGNNGGGDNGGGDNGGGDNGGGDDTTPPSPVADLLITDDVGAVQGAITNGTTTDDNTPTLSGTAEAGSTVSIYDGTTLLGTVTVGADGTWSFTTAALTDGQHSLTVTVTDPAGNTSTATDPVEFTVDTLAPDAIGDLSVINNDGAVALPITQNGVTNDSTPILSGTAEAGSTVTISDGTTVLGTVLVGADGTWNFTSPALGEGSHTLSITATDIAGNVSPATTLTFTVDTLAPDAVTGLLVSDDAGEIQPGAETNDSTLTFSGQAEAGTTVSVYDGDTLLGSAVVDAEGNWTFTTPELTNGPHSITTTVTDAAGNVSVESDAFTVNIDAALPPATTSLEITDDTGSTLVQLNDGDYTRDNTPTLSGLAAANATVVIYNGDVELGTVTADADGQWQFDTTDLPDGTYVFHATATDTDGNIVDSGNITIIIDTLVPEPAADLQLSNDEGSTAVPVTPGGATNDTTPVLSGTAEPGTVVTISDGDTQLGTVTVGDDGNWSFTSPTLTEGDHSITTTVTDPAGNVSTPSDPITFTVDTQPPAAVTGLLVTDDVGDSTGPLASGAITDDNTPTLSGQAEANSTVNVYDGTTLLGTVTVDADGNWSYTPPALSNGDHSLTLTVTDPAGNVSAATPAFDLTVDADLPPATSSLQITDDSGSTLVLLADGAFTKDTTPTLSGLATPNSTVVIFNGDVELGTVTADASGQWQFDTTTLADGVYVFHATATDAAGNVADSGNITITIDSLVPDAAADVVLSNDQSGTPVPVTGGATNDTTPVLSGTAEPGSTVTILDGTTTLGTVPVDADGNWSFTTPVLTEGDHSLTTTVSDAAGNTSPASDAISFSVDTQPPAAAVSLVFNNDTTGTLVPITTGATNDTTPVLTGWAETGSTVTLVLDGGTPVTVPVDAEGNWSYTLPELPEGDHTLTTTVTDAAGNTSPAADPLTITIDLTPPEAATDVVLTNDDGVVIGADAVINDVAPVLSGTAEPGSTVTVSDGDTPLGTAIVGDDGTWTFNTPELGEGAHSITATVTDPAGNSSPATDPITFTVDITSPETATNIVISNDEGATPTPVTTGATNDTTPVLSGTAEVGSTVTVSENGNVIGTALVDADGNWTFTVTDPLDDGVHTFTTTVTDPAGNVSPVSAPLDLVIDTVAPTEATAVLLSNNEGNTLVPILDGDFTNDSTPVYSGGANSAETGSTVNVLDNGVVIGTATVAADGSWSFTLPQLDDGPHSLTAVVVDPAGNESPASPAIGFQIDTVAPDVAQDLVFSNDSGATPVAIAEGGVTNDNTPVLSGTAEANSTITILEDNVVLATTTADADGNWSYTPTLSDGTYAFTVTVTDPVGNVSAASDPVTLTIDTVAPTVADLALSNNQAAEPVAIVDGGLTNDNTPVLTGTAEAGSIITIYDGDDLTAAPLGTITVDDTGIWSFTVPDGTPLTDGLHALNVTATDPAGNVSAPAVINVEIDTVQPDAAADLTLANDNGSAVVVIDGVTYTNDSTPLISGTAAAGSVVNVSNGDTLLGTATVGTDGTWTVTLTEPLDDVAYTLTVEVVDAAGNISAPQTLTFTVDTVAPDATTLTLTNDNVAPGVPVEANTTTNDNTPLLSGAAEAGSVVTVYDENQQVVGTTVALEDGTWSLVSSALTDGTHTFYATVTDEVGNVSENSPTFTLTVDATAPEPVTDLLLQNDEGDAPVDIANGGITNDATPVISGTAEPGSTITLVNTADGSTFGTVTADATTGVWTFTPDALTDGTTYNLAITVTDEAGNSSAATNVSFTVDLTPPEPIDVADFAIYNNDGTSLVLIANGGLTNDATPELLGTGTPGTTVNIYQDAVLVGTAAVSDAGEWRFDVAALTDNTPHVFTVAAVDAAGNLSDQSAGYTITVDAVVPDAVGSLVVTDNVGDAQGPLLTGAVTDDNTPTFSGTAEAGTTVSVYEGATLLGTAVVGEDTTWTITPIALGNGTHNFSIIVTDIAGNVSTATPFVLDVEAGIPPATSTLEITDDAGTTLVALLDGASTNDSTPVFSGLSTAGSTIAIYDGVNAAPLATVAVGADGQWSFTPAAAIAEGTYGFFITTTDGVGNVTTSDTITITIDVTVPDAAIDLLVSNDDVATPVPIADGTSTNDNTPLVSGTAEAGSLVTLYDGTTVIGTVTADAVTGAWSLNTPQLSNGDHALSVTVTDAAGNVSDPSPTLTFTVDTAAPAAVTLVVTNDETGVPVANGGSTNDATPTLSGTAEDGALVTIFDGTDAIGTVTAVGGVWEFTPAADLEPGTHNFSASATDAAGNVSVASATATVIIDVDAPIAATITASNDNGAVAIPIADNGSTNDSTPALSGTAEAGSTVTILQDGAPLATVTASAAGTWNYSPAALADGAHTFTVTATDAAGNVSPAATLTLNVVTTGPVPVTDLVVTDNVGTLTGALASGATTDDTTPTLSGTAGALGNIVTVYDGTAILGTVTAGAGGAWEFTTAALSNGPHALSVTVTDPAGNTSTATAFPITVDTIAPTASTLVITNDVANTVIPNGGVTNDTTPTLSGVAEANSTVNIFEGAALLGTVLADANGAWNFTTGVLGTGAHTLTVSVTDAAGNVSGSTAATVNIDTTAPGAVTFTTSNNNGTVATPILNNGTTNDNTPLLTGTAEAGSRVTILDGTTPLGTVTAGATGAWSFTSTTLADGVHTLNVTATDTAGNVGPATAITFTVDSVAPLAVTGLTVSDNVGTTTGTLTSGAFTDDNTPTLAGTAEANALVTIYDGATILGTVAADAAGAWTYTTTALTDGAHQLSVTATDAAGNVSPATTPVAITVDTVAPAAVTALAVDNTGNTLTGTGEANSTVTVRDAGGAIIGTATTDSAGAFTVALTTAQTTGALLSVTQTDRAGNVSPTASVGSAIRIAAVNDTNEVDYTSQVVQQSNALSSISGTALLSVGVGTILSATVIGGSNPLLLTVGADDSRQVSVNATLNGINLLVNYSLNVYQEQPNGSWSLVQSIPNYIAGLIGIGPYTGGTVALNTLTTGTYAVVLASNLNVSVLPTTTIRTTNDVTTLAVTVAATVTGNLLTNDTSSVDGVVPVGTAVTSVGAVAVNETGSTSISSAYGTLNIDSHGQYTYTLKGGLDIDTLPATDSFTYSVRDAAGAVTSATLTVTLNEGAAATLLSTNSLVAESTGTESDASGSIYGDSTDSHTGTLSIINEAGDVTTVNTAGTTSIAGDYGVLNVDASGHYTYTLNAEVSAQSLLHKEVFSYSLAATDGTITQNTFTIDLHPTITGTAGADTLTGGAYDDTITAGAGADTLVYHLLATADATGGNGHDTWTDFNVAQGDKIDVSDLLIGWNDSTSNVNDFVKVDHTSDGNTVLSIDRDGTGTAFSSAQLVTLEGVNVSLEELLQQPHQNTTA